MDLVISCTCILVHACTHVFWIVVLRMSMLSQTYYKVKNKNIQRDPLENTQIHVQNVRRIEVSQDRDELRKILGWNWPGGRSFFKVEYWSGGAFSTLFFFKLRPKVVKFYTWGHFFNCFNFFLFPVLKMTFLKIDHNNKVLNFSFELELNCSKRFE